MAKLNILKHQATNDSTIAQVSKKKVARRKTTVIAESRLQNKKMISNDKSNSCQENIQNIPFSKMLVQDLISNENSSYSCLKNAVKEELDKLWLPTETDCVDLESNYLNGSSLKTMLNSWFSISKIFLHSKNLSPTSYQLSPSFHVEFTDSENTVTRSRKIRIYPTHEQKKILNYWFGCSRFVYNRTLDYLNQPNTKASWLKIKTGILTSLPEWSKKVPFQIKTIAIRDCCKAVSNAKKKFRETGEFQKVHYRSKKRQDYNIFIPKSAVTEQGVYLTLLGELYASEKLWIPEHDCRLILKNDRYFLCVPKNIPVKRPENQRLSACALDPGVRTFQTLYSNDICQKIGEHSFSRIYRYCLAMDRLISRNRKEKTNKFTPALRRIRWKIRDLIDEIHNKTALMLCKLFDIIYLPTFETSKMVTKLRHKTSRQMLTWAHYRFKMKLKNKAEEYSCSLVDCNEAYTSKTCGVCGEINTVGGKEIWTCSHCGQKHDRDINGARNIFFKNIFLAMRDSSMQNQLCELNVTNGNICE